MTTPVHGMRARPSGGARPSVRLSLRGIASLVAAVALLVGAYLSGWSELLILGCFAALPTLLSLLHLWRARPQVAVSRAVIPEVLPAGRSGSVRVVIANRAGAALPAAHWFERLPWPPGRSPRGELPRLPAGASIAFGYRIEPPQRGVFELGPTLIERGDPFGLVSLVLRQEGRTRLVVGPAIDALDRTPTAIASDSGATELFQHRSLAGEHDLMTRDWRPGDALRTVHWRASAHHGQLMVREEEHQSHAQATILFETRRSAFPDAVRTLEAKRVESEGFERVLSLGCSLRRFLLAEGISVRVAETGPARLTGRGMDFLESAARIRLSTTAGPGEVLAEGQGLCFAVLSTMDASLAGALVAAAPRFDRRVAFVSSIDGEDAARLDAAGWTVVVVPAGASAAEAWMLLVDRLQPQERAKAGA